MRFFAKTQDAPRGAVHPLGAPARLAFGIGALRPALRARGRLSPPRARFCPRGGVQRKEKQAYLYVPRARGRILADAPALTLARVLAHCCKRFRRGARARVGIWVVYNRRCDRGYLRALVKLAPRAQVRLPSAVKLASQVKFAFFAKTQDAPRGAVHPLGAPLSSGWYAKEGW